jgi:hypothetical protein
MKEVRLTLVGGPTALIEYGPPRILTGGTVPLTRTKGTR